MKTLIKIYFVGKQKKEGTKRSMVKFYKSVGIQAENTTHEHIGQTKLVFTNKVAQKIEDDSLEASLRHLKFNRK